MIEVTKTPTPAQAPTIAEAGERLVRNLEAQGRKASTLAAYETTLRVHLVPHFGERPVHGITTEDVEAFIASCNAKGCAPKSIRNYLGALHAILDFAKGALLVNGGGIDGGDGAYFTNCGDDLHAVGTLAPIVEGYIGCIVIRPDGSRVLARAVPDPLAE